MKRRLLRLLSMTTACLLFSTMAAGCSRPASSQSSKTSQSSGAQNLKYTQLQVYMVGDAPAGMNPVTEKLNELAKKDLNCEVKFNFTTWTDYSQKYALWLTSGQPIDLIYTATWLDFQKYANNGAFRPLEPYLAKDAPDLKAHISDTLWNQVKIKGNIYTIPSTYKEFITDGFLYRKDLQKKYGLPTPDSVDNIEKYLLGVKQHDPSQQLTNEPVNSGVTNESFGAFDVFLAKYHWTGLPQYGLVEDYSHPSKIINYWESQDFIEDMKTMKRWADEGIWSRSALSNQNDDSAFKNGKIVCTMSGMNPASYASALIAVQSAHPDWEVGYSSYAESSGVALYAHPLQNGMAVPISSKNPDRALMFYQKLVLDKTYNQLSEYGILGTNYTVTSDGHYKAVGSDGNGFGYEALNGWAWRNPDTMLFDSSHDATTAVNKSLDSIASKSAYKGVNIQDGFAEDYSAYQPERAALGTVMTQYLAPLEAGLVPDVDTAVKTFLSKAKAAGLDKIQADYTKQWQQYCKENGYN